MNAYKTLMAALLSLGISASSFAKVSISVAVPLSLNSRSLNIAQNENTVSGPSVETCESEPILAILDADEDLRNETITRLVNILSDAQEDPTLRTRAAGVLAILGPRIQDTVPELLFVLRNDPDFEIRAAAAYALHNIKAADKDLIHELSNALLSPQLIQEIEGRRSDNTGIFFVENISSEEEEKDSILDSYYNLQAMAAYILANTDSNIEIAIPNLTKALTSPDPSVQVGVRNALRAHSGPDPSNLIKILKNETPEVRNDVLNSLVEIGPQAVPSILAALRTDNLIVQRSAIYALGEIEEPYETESERLELEAELLEILRSTPDLNTTILATFTLAKVGSNIDLEPYFLSIFENVDLNFYDPIFDAFIDYSSVNSIAKITPEYPSLTIALWSKAYNQKAKNALNIVWEENGFNLVDALISLIETLQDLDDQGRLGGEDIDSVIAQLLSYMDLDEANLALADIAQNSDIGLSIRTSAARSLGQIGPANSEAMSTKEVMSVLFEMVQNSEINPEIRLSAATTLYDLNSDFSSVDSAMVEMVQSSDMEPGIRVSAASALIDSAWSRTLESIIQSGDTSLISDSAALTIESLEILGIDGSDIVSALIEIAKSSGNDLNIKVSAVNALERLELDDLENIAKLTMMLLDSNTDSSVRAAVVTVLGSLNSNKPEVISAFIKTIQNPNVEWEVRISAAEALLLNPKFDSSEAISILISLVQNSSIEWDARISAAKILHQSPDPEAKAALTETLAEMLQKSDPSARIFSARAFDILYGERFNETINLIEIALNPEIDPNTRASVVKVLSNLNSNNTEAIEMLITMLQNHDPNLRASAAEVLFSFSSDNPEVVGALIQILLDSDIEPYGRISAAAILSNLSSDNPEVITALIEILQDPNTDRGVRASAAKALGNLGTDNAEVIAALLETLKDSNTDPNLRNYVALPLSILGLLNPEVLTGLSKTLQNREIDPGLRADAVSGMVPSSPCLPLPGVPDFRTINFIYSLYGKYITPGSEQRSGTGPKGGNCQKRRVEGQTSCS